MGNKRHPKNRKMALLKNNKRRIAAEMREKKTKRLQQKNIENKNLAQTVADSSVHNHQTSNETHSVPSTSAENSGTPLAPLFNLYVNFASSVEQTETSGDNLDPLQFIITQDVSNQHCDNYVFAGNSNNHTEVNDEKLTASEEHKANEYQSTSGTVPITFESEAPKTKLPKTNVTKRVPPKNKVPKRKPTRTLPKRNIPHRKEPRRIKPKLQPVCKTCMCKTEKKENTAPNENKNLDKQLPPKMTSCEAFGYYLGLELKELESQYQRCLAEELIGEVLYNARMENLNTSTTIILKD